MITLKAFKEITSVAYHTFREAPKTIQVLKDVGNKDYYKIRAIELIHNGDLMAALIVLIMCIYESKNNEKNKTD